MATSPYPFPFPAAATYPAPTPGFSPVPAYGAPPAYPCAATYTYPPPATAYTAAAGFFPAPAFPYAAPFPYPPSPPGFFQAPAPATGTSAQPWVSLSTNPGLDPVRVFQPPSANTTATAPVRRPDRVPSAPIPCGSSSTSSRLLDTVRTPPNRDRTPLQSSFDSLHAASSFVSSPSSPLRASFVEPAAMIASTTATNASMLPAAPAYVASQVFDKMATPSTGHGTQATTPDCCSGHQTPVQSSCMQDGETKLSCNYQAFTPPRNDQLSEKQTRSVTEAQSIGDMAVQIQAKIKSMSEILSQALKRREIQESKQPTTSQPNTDQIAPHREHRPPQCHTSPTPRASGFFQIEHSSSTVQPGKPDEKFVRKHMGSSTLPRDNASPRHCLLMQDDAVDQQRARDRISCDAILGEIARLSAAVRLYSSVGKNNNPSPQAVYTNEASEDSPNSQPQGSHNYSSTIAATAYDNTQVTCEMRQSYDFNNLKRQTVFLADGSEHSYYMLPEDSPIEQATPIFPPAGKSVGVMVSRFVPAQAARLASGLCSKANNTAVSESLKVHDVQPPTVVQDDPIGLKEMHVSDVSEEEKHQQQDSEKALISVQHLGASRQNVLVIRERINEWDPGIHTILSSTPDNDICYRRVPSRLINHEIQFLSDPSIFNTIMKIPPVVNWSSLESLPYAVILSPSILLSMIINAATSIPNIVVILPLLMLWDPGGTTFPMFMTAADATKLQCTYFWNPKMVHVFAVDFSARGATFFAYATTCYLAFDLRWTETVLVLAIPCSKGEPVATHVVLLSNGGCSMANHCFLQMFMQSLCAATTVQVTEQRHHLKFIWMSVILRTVSEFRDGQLTYMPQSPTISSSEFLRQSAMSNTSCVWDPGIKSIFFSCKRLNITELVQIKGWTSMTYSGISLSEYTYILIFLNDQGKFVRQREAHETDSAKHLLLSSPIYLQNREMDIFFITFLPP